MTQSVQWFEQCLQANWLDLERRDKYIIIHDQAQTEAILPVWQGCAQLRVTRPWRWNHWALISVSSCITGTINVRVSQNLKKIVNISVVRSRIEVGLFVIALHMSQHNNSDFYLAKIHWGIWAERIRVNKVKNQGFTKDCHMMSHVLMPWIHTKFRLLLSRPHCLGFLGEHKTQELQSDSNYCKWVV